MSRLAALGCLATVAAADYVILRRTPRWILIGPFDHAAHLATAGLVRLNIDPRPPGWSAGFLAGALLPDMDHVPLALRRQRPTAGDPRPVSHCLLAIAPVAALAAHTRSPALAGTAAGMLAHFGRDVAVGTGVPLLWPARARSLRVPYAVYAATCVLLGLRAAVRKGADRATLGGGL